MSLIVDSTLSGLPLSPYCLCDGTVVLSTFCGFSDVNMDLVVHTSQVSLPQPPHSSGDIDWGDRRQGPATLWEISRIVESCKSLLQFSVVKDPVSKSVTVNIEVYWCYGKSEVKERDSLVY